jgi:hypothetical protein
MILFRLRLAAFLLLTIGVAARADAGIFTATNTNDAGAGSFRAALDAANSNPGVDEIRFAIPGNGPHILFPQTRFTLSDTVFIDGYSQPGAQANSATIGSNAQLKIAIDGSQVAPVFEENTVLGIESRASGSTVRGLVFMRPRGVSILIYGPSSENHIAGNFFGVEPDGVTPALGPGALNIEGGFNLVGGATPAQRNLIVASGSPFVLLYESAVRNVVRGNLIGVDRNETPIPAGFTSGLSIVRGAGYNRIGDYGDSLPNVFGGSRYWGLSLASSAGIGNQVAAAKFIGNGRLLDMGSWDDPLDADSGPNERMNRPAIVGAGVDLLNDLRIELQVHSTPNRLFRIGLYGSDAGCTSPQNAERYLGHVDVLTDAQGNARFVHSLPAGLNPPRGILATAAAEALNVDSTSDFSPCVAVSIPRHTITPTASVGGSIAPATPVTLERYTTADFTLAAQPGFLLAEVSGCPGTLSRNVFTAGPIFGDCTLHARYVPSGPQLMPETVANGRVGEVYSEAFLAAGGTPPYAFSSSGALPPGLAFTLPEPDAMALSGTPTAVGRYVFSVIVRDAQQQTASRSYTLDIARAEQSIDFPAQPARAFPGPAVTLAATASSALAVSFASTTPAICTVSGTQLTLLALGTCSVVANQAGNATYEAAPPVTRSFAVIPAHLFGNGFE